jgi:hypothetical protein
MASIEQKRKLLKAKIAVALQSELGRVPNEAEVEQHFNGLLSGAPHGPQIHGNRTRRVEMARRDVLELAERAFPARIFTRSPQPPSRAARLRPHRRVRTVSSRERP